MQSSGMLRIVAAVRADVSEQRIGSINRAALSVLLLLTLFLASRFLSP
jgi:hypothetical protein